MAKRKKNKVVEEPKIKELLGFKLGDSVFGRVANAKIYEGEIVQFHPNNKEGPCITVITREFGYRIFLISSASFDKKDLGKK
jgi:hypothetical protein